ncbi:MAG: thiamine pyrophosphate-dependent enzyme [Bdellovibrionota bacterium]
MSKRKSANVDWQRVARTVLTSRLIDHVEETTLYPEKKIAYQFSARGHELCQVLLGLHLTHSHDAAAAYYRSRPLLLTLGLSIEDAFAGPLGKSGGLSDGRDIGVVFNLRSNGGATVLPMAGDVGSQYTPAAGWASGIRFHREVLKTRGYESSIAVVFGGEGSVATNGFWSALTMATTEHLPLLFLIEDNGYAISVPSDKQTPGGDIVQNLRAFGNLRVLAGDGTDPLESASLIEDAVRYVRSQQLPALLRLKVPRLSGHSGQDTQTYKPLSLLRDERKRDPLKKLRTFLVPDRMSAAQWKKMQRSVEEEVHAGLEIALARQEPDPRHILKHIRSEKHSLPASLSSPHTSSQRVNMGEAIRLTLASELRSNPRMLLFGEDVAVKGGVHAVTLNLQDEFGPRRVFDTSLSEEGIIGRANGLALSGLLPVPEIQFRKYADPATEQLHNCGTLRWRTAGKFASPMVVRMAGGFSRRAGDPWHSVSSEVTFAHAVGWHIAVPSNAADAVGLLRAALRGEDPCIFFEHRALLDAPSARRPYPGDDYIIPLGTGARLRNGDSATVVTWGGMVERCEAAIEQGGLSCDLIDLRTVVPWDRELVLESVHTTHRCLIVHEDGRTSGFGAEIAAVVADEAFSSLDAPVRRLAVRDIPIPYNPALMEETLPSASDILRELQALISF